MMAHFIIMMKFCTDQIQTNKSWLYNLVCTGFIRVQAMIKDHSGISFLTWSDNLVQVPSK